MMVDGREALEVRVRAAPEGGKANRELVELLAAALSLGKREVQLVIGETSRLKRISVPLSEDDVQIRVA